MAGILQSRVLRRLPYGLVLLGAILIVVWALSLVVEWSGASSTSGARVQSQSTDGQIEALQARLALRPVDPNLHIQLAEAYLQKGRETSAPRYYARAEDALFGALDLDAENSSAMNSLGSVALARHEFAEAMEWAERSLGVNRINPDAYGVLGSAQAELGRYAAATDSFQMMVDLKPNLASYANVAYVRNLTGDADGAVEAMKLAVAAAPRGTENSAWANHELADIYFDAGNLNEAEKYFQAALNDFPGYHEALTGLGHIRAAEGDDDAAKELFQRSLSVYPDIEAMAALGDLLALSGQADEARLKYDAVEEVAYLPAVGQQPYNRELALFYADHDLKPQEALEHAVLELEVRQDIYGYDALAWTLYKNGRFAEAAEAIAQAMQLGTQDATLYYHSGMIHYELGDRARAREHLERALELNPHFSLLQSGVASQTLSVLTGERPTP